MKRKDYDDLNTDRSRNASNLQFDTDSNNHSPYLSGRAPLTSYQDERFRRREHRPSFPTCQLLQAIHVNEYRKQYLRNLLRRFIEPMHIRRPFVCTWIRCRAPIEQELVGAVLIFRNIGWTPLMILIIVVYYLWGVRKSRCKATMWKTCVTLTPLLNITMNTVSSFVQSKASLLLTFVIW